LGMSADLVRQVRIGSMLHDVGKIGIQDSILQKPGPLTIKEFDVMKKHPDIGAKIMGTVRMLQEEIPALNQHHERVDGKGYPHGLKEHQISMIGRIVAVADVFDAVTSERPYRQAISPKEALALLQKETEGHLDQQCVQALINAYRKGQIKTQKERAHFSPQT